MFMIHKHSRKNDNFINVFNHYIGTLTKQYIPTSNLEWDERIVYGAQGERSQEGGKGKHGGSVLPEEGATSKDLIKNV